MHSRRVLLLFHPVILGVKIMIRRFAASIAIVLGIASVSPAHAATLDVQGGQLVGAFGVNVSGTLYDVQFLDGTCVAIFSGCDNAAADFDFGSVANADAAAQALLDQVFLDAPSGNFDSEPNLTAGITNSTYGYAFIPVSTDGVSVGFSYVRNGDNITFADLISPNDGNCTSPGGCGDLVTDDLGQSSIYTWARFTPSPVPIAAIFPIFAVVMGLFGFVGWRRRRAAATA